VRNWHPTATKRSKSIFDLRDVKKTAEVSHEDLAFLDEHFKEADCIRGAEDVFLSFWHLHMLMQRTRRNGSALD